MTKGQQRRIGRLFSTSVLVTLVVAGVMATAAWAAGNTVSVKPPSNAKVSPSTCSSSTPTGCRVFSISLSGHAKTSARLYMFLDYHACGANPAVEYDSGDAGYVWGVSGSFHKVSKGWYSDKSGTDHVCAYLQKPSQPENSAGGILAHRFARFTIHK